MQHEWHEPLVLVGSGVNAAAALGAGGWAVALVAFGVTATIGGAIVRVMKRPSYESLLAGRDEAQERAANSTLSVQDLLGLVLYGLGNDLGLSPRERISVYVHDGEAFVMIARHSSDQTLKRPGRSIYPEDEGVIGLAWKYGQHQVDDLPDYTHSPHEYVARMADDYDMAPETVRNLKMKSRSLAAVCLPADLGVDSIGVLVVESLDPHTIDEPALERLLTHETKGLLDTYMLQNRELLPTMSMPKELGF
jgi:hypothetical protein